MSPLVVPVPDGRPVLIVADTHSQPHRALAGHLERLQPAAVLHAGDIGDPAVLDRLAGHGPVVAVRGNIDGHALPDDHIVDLDFGGSHLRLLLTHIALNGPRLLPEPARTARENGASLVVCGHSHVPFLGSDRGLAVFNPGSIGPKRFSLPILFGTLTLEDGAVRLRHWEAESGRAWAPR
jgi:putative phosphoesterase